MAIYESMVVYGGRLEGQEIEEQISKFQKAIETGKGEIHSIERMGKRHLAYEIMRNQDGYYTVFHFQAEPKLIAPLQRSLRLNESVLRHIVLRKDKFPEGPTVAVEEVATAAASAPPHAAEAEPVAPRAQEAETPAEEVPAETAAVPETAEAPSEQADAAGAEAETEEPEPAPRAEAEAEAEEPEKPKEGTE
ncbi:MAG: 30S ribosomal protein S6 [Candidatus Eisenbacteria bacterium]|nr:30S ribosomal protein S6 [Candidatus Eisenbacteria bacterium]